MPPKKPETTDKAAHPLPYDVEHIIALMRRLGWRRVRSDLMIQAAPERVKTGYDNLFGAWPVFEIGARRCVVGPTWTTFYSVNWRQIQEGTLRSVKTSNYEEVEAEAEGTSHQVDVGGES